MRKRVAVVVLALFAVSSCSQEEPITIMPIGDSITQGSIGTASYRCYLDERLQDAGVAFDFVGSQTEPYPVGSGLGYDCPHEFDQDHEGYTGATIEEAGLTALPAVREFQPDVALVHLGTNDILGFVPAADAVSDLESLILDLQAAHPTISVLVAQIIPCSLPDKCFREEMGPAFHEAVGALDSLATDQSLVLVVDMSTTMREMDVRPDRINCAIQKGAVSQGRA